MSVRVSPFLRRAAPVLLLLLSACATEREVPSGSPAAPVPVVRPPLAPPAQPQAPAETPPLVTRPLPAPPGGYPKSIRESGAGTAVLALARQAQESRAAGRYEASLGQLERALRIEPRNPFVWQALAETHLLLQHADQAENAAQKSTSLGRGNPYLESGNWRLIAAARQQKGDGSGAQHATSRADELSGGLSTTP